jgi:pimeloyl-ACP methyl ester carboxylesterase
MDTTVMTTRNGNYVDVRGLATYYEVTGAGEPVVLLHGGMCTAETFDLQTSSLSERYRVFVPERFGHGRTPDVDGPITYENMAEHTVSFMDTIGLESASLIGWSDGALVAALVALRRPKLVGKLVLVDQFISLDRTPASYVPFMQGMTVDTFPPAIAELYKAVSPDGPDHFSAVFDKLHAMWLAPTGIEVSDLTRIAAPTLVLAADDGAVTAAHAGEIIASLSDAQLAVLPGTTHGLLMEKPHLANRLLLDFLADEQAPKLFPTD